jgi:hypothetical protein
MNSDTFIPLNGRSLLGGALMPYGSYANRRFQLQDNNPMIQGAGVSLPSSNGFEYYGAYKDWTGSDLAGGSQSMAQMRPPPFFGFGKMMSPLELNSRLAHEAAVAEQGPAYWNTDFTQGKRRS